MPIYPYKCGLCGHEEEIQKPASHYDLPEHCTNCVETKGLQVAMERLIAKTSFQLKGPGWAKDGYSK